MTGGERWVGADPDPRISERDPKPMTPERARKLARRWGWAGVALIAPAVALAFLPDPLDWLRMPVYAVAMVCGANWSGWSSWADGVEAERRRLGGRQR